MDIIDAMTTEAGLTVIAFIAVGVALGMGLFEAVRRTVDRKHPPRPL